MNYKLKLIEKIIFAEEISQEKLLNNNLNYLELQINDQFP